MILKVYQDTREKRPLMFPETIELGGRLYTVEVIKKELVTGDYLLDPEAPAAMIERKGSIDELYQNLFTKDRARFFRSLERIKDSPAVCYLLLDFRWWSCEPRKGTVDEILDALWDVVVRFDLRPLAMGDYPQPAARRQYGGQLLRLLWSHERPKLRNQLITNIGGENVNPNL